jgi:hypothetical protein
MRIGTTNDREPFAPDERKRHWLQFRQVRAFHPAIGRKEGGCEEIACELECIAAVNPRGHRQNNEFGLPKRLSP